ncbi:hypothetical protein INT43_003062 [Umbelopsis isabellina]|uniref:Uncharacterized protein n=1 Tax=Mortierella isabellina TaxID=91625 RepID=A0A8H7UCF2_MORIS|nr:hypothetical protein INT43_003062 [Umbelopsis isabellina]
MYIFYRRCNRYIAAILRQDGCYAILGTRLASQYEDSREMFRLLLHSLRRLVKLDSCLSTGILDRWSCYYGETVP